MPGWPCLPPSYLCDPSATTLTTRDSSFYLESLRHETKKIRARFPNIPHFKGDAFSLPNYHLFTFPPPFSRPHCKHTENTLVVTLSDSQWQAGATLRRGFWSSRWASQRYFGSPLFHLCTSYNSSTSLFGVLHSYLFHARSLKTNLFPHHP